MEVKFFKRIGIDQTYQKCIIIHMGTNLNKSPEHLGYIDEIHRLNTEFDVIELIQSIQTIQSSKVDDWTVADYIRV